MGQPKLSGRWVLIVEDEPLIAMDVGDALLRAGASVTTATTLKQALRSVELEGLSAAILDHVLGEGTTICLRDRLQERRIPFVIYTGFTGPKAPGDGALHLQKPAAGDMLVAAVAGLLDARKAGT